MGAEPEVGMSFAHANGRERSDRNGGACTHEKVLIGVDPHKASVAVAVVDEAIGELIERTSFPQNRAGLRALENALGDTVPQASLGRRERRRPRSSPGREAGSDRRVGGRRAAQALSTSAGALNRQCPQERQARCPRHRVGRFAQRAAGNGRSRGRVGSAAPAFREARRLGDRAYPSAQPPARASTRPRPRWGNWKALDPPSRIHILRGIRSQGASARLRRQLASEILRDIRTLQRKIADLDGRIEAEVEASGTTLTEIFGVKVQYWPRRSSERSAMWCASRPRPTLPPTPVLRRRWRPRVARWYATGSRWSETASSIMLCTWSPGSAKVGRTFG